MDIIILYLNLLLCACVVHLKAGNRTLRAKNAKKIFKKYGIANHRRPYFGPIRSHGSPLKPDRTRDDVGKKNGSLRSSPNFGECPLPLNPLIFGEAADRVSGQETICILVNII